MEFQSFVIENLRALTSKKKTPLKGTTGQNVSYCATLSSFKIDQVLQVVRFAVS